MRDREIHPGPTDAAPPGEGVPTFIFDPPSDERPAERRCLEVALFWQGQLMSVRHYAPPRAVFIGEHRQNDFPVASDQVVGRFRLVEPAPDGARLCWTEAMAVEITNPGGDVWIPETRRVRLGLDERAAVQVGELTFRVQYVSRVRLGRASLRRVIDFYYTKILSLSFVAHICLMVALLLTPSLPEPAEPPLDEIHPLVFRLLRPPVEPPQAQPRQPLPRLSGPATPEPAGRYGRLDAARRETAPGRRGSRLVDPHSREQDVAAAQGAGLLRVLSQEGIRGSPVLGHLLGDEIDRASDGLRGTHLGDQRGVNGLATRGQGPGGGGDTIGLPGLGGLGPGGVGLVLEDPTLRARDRGPSGPPDGPEPEASCLTQAQVLRVLDRLQRQARYCYELGLRRNPNLEGKVTTRFEIDSAGNVAEARVIASSLDDHGVEACVVNVVRRQRFPACKNGVAVVTYPWIFKHSGR